MYITINLSNSYILPLTSSQLVMGKLVIKITIKSNLKKYPPSILILKFHHLLNIKNLESRLFTLKILFSLIIQQSSLISYLSFIVLKLNLKELDKLSKVLFYLVKRGIKASVDHLSKKSYPKGMLIALCSLQDGDLAYFHKKVSIKTFQPMEMLFG